MTGIALPEYSRVRNKDVEAMCDLAMYNYIEVTAQKSFLIKSREMINRWHSRGGGGSGAPKLGGGVQLPPPPPLMFWCWKYH